jgi:hypothetical protein
MNHRCYNNKNKDYKDYGGRGVKVCAHWRVNFLDFYNWCMINGWKQGLEIDRRENDGNYEPDNVHFISRRKNILNQRLLLSTNKSGYRGVCWNKANKKWTAKIIIKGKRIYLKRHRTKEEAVQARNNYIIKNNLQSEYKIQEYKGD